MKKAFKVASVIGSTLLLGVSTVMAGGVFSPFVVDNTPNFSAIYGDTSADAAAAATAGNYLNGLVDVPTTPVVTPTDDGSNVDSGINKVNILMGTETDELFLGESIPEQTFDDGDIDYLIDDKLSWDDGDDDKDYDVHEEIKLLDGKLGFSTVLSDEDFKEDYAMTNNKGISYRYVFDETPDFSKLGSNDADNMKIKFLGKTLEIKEADDNTIKVVTSEEQVVAVDQKLTVNGVELTINEIFENHVQVNGKLIEEGKTEKVDGLVVEVDTVAYQSSDKPSKALIRVGKDISEEYSSGDAYIGEDEDDPKWVWDIDLEASKPYIGVIYNEKEVDSDDDVLYTDEAYILPEGYAAVKFAGTSKVEYTDFSLMIDEKELYDSDENKLFDGDDKSVIILEGEDGSIETAQKNEETSKLYLYYNHDDDRVESYYYDDNENKAMEDEFTISNGSSGKVATITNDDKDVSVIVSLDGTDLTVTFVDGGDDQIVANYKVSSSTDTILSLGNDDESAEDGEVLLSYKGNMDEVGDKDYDVVNDMGYKILNSNANGDNDEVSISVPSDKVEATIAVGKPEVIESEDDMTDDTTDDDTTDPVVTPTPTPDPAYTYITSKVSQIDNVKDRNLVVVGGSCINGVAAQLLGGQLCGAEFTTATGVGPGQALIKSFQSPYAADKIAVVVAGYDAADTTRAVNEFNKGTYDLTVGKQYIV